MLCLILEHVCWIAAATCCIDWLMAKLIAAMEAESSCNLSSNFVNMTAYTQMKSAHACWTGSIDVSGYSRQEKVEKCRCMNL